MSKEIAKVGNLIFGTFAGGKLLGKCVQITHFGGFIQFPISEIDGIVHILEKIKEANNGKKRNEREYIILERALEMAFNAIADILPCPPNVKCARGSGDKSICVKCYINYFIKEAKAEIQREAKK